MREPIHHLTTDDAESIKPSKTTDTKVAEVGSSHQNPCATSCGGAHELIHVQSIHQSIFHHRYYSYLSHLENPSKISVRAPEGLAFNRHRADFLLNQNSFLRHLMPST